MPRQTTLDALVECTPQLQARLDAARKKIFDAVGPLPAAVPEPPAVAFSSLAAVSAGMFGAARSACSSASTRPTRASNTRKP